MIPDGVTGLKILDMKIITFALTSKRFLKSLKRLMNKTNKTSKTNKAQG